MAPKKSETSEDDKEENMTSLQRLRGPFSSPCAPADVAGVLGRMGVPLRCAAAQVCREAGARVTTNMHVRDMGLGRVPQPGPTPPGGCA